MSKRFRAFWGCSLMTPLMAAMAASAVLLALPGSGQAATPPADTLGSYGHCTPVCVVYKQIGDQQLAIAVGADGAFLGMSPVEGPVGAMLTAADPPPAPAPFRRSFAWSAASAPVSAETQFAAGCGEVTFEQATDSYETATHYVIVVVTEVYCSGKLIDVDVHVIRVPLPTQPGPN